MKTLTQDHALPSTNNQAIQLVWRRKHGRGLWLSNSQRPVWTLVPVAAR